MDTKHLQHAQEARKEPVLKKSKTVPKAVAKSRKSRKTVRQIPYTSRNQSTKRLQPAKTPENRLALPVHEEVHNSFFERYISTH